MAAGVVDRMRERWARLPPAVRTGLIAVVGTVTLITLAREGAFGRDRELDLSYFSTNTNWNMSWNSGGSGSNVDAEPVMFAGRWVECAVECRGDEALCEGFNAEFRCEGGKPAPPGAQVVHVSGSFSFQEEPFCYVPLQKSGTAPFNLALTVSASHPGANKSWGFQGNGSVTQEISGIASCLRFKRDMGRVAAQAVTQNLNDFLRKN